MLGLDKSRFIGLRKSDEELLCGICLAILNEPVVTPCCSQTYCGDCLREWLEANDTCPNDRKELDANDLLQPARLVTNMLDKMEIMCDFNEKGCDKHIGLGQLKGHIETCRYNPFANCNVCNEKNGEIDNHVCINNLLAKTKSLEISYEELMKKYNEYFENAEKENKNNEKIIGELFERCTKLNEVIKRLKSEKREMNKRIKNMTEFNTKSNKQLKDSVKQMNDLQNEFENMEQNLQIENDSFVNLSNNSESEEENEVEKVVEYSVNEIRCVPTLLIT